MNNRVFFLVICFVSLFINAADAQNYSSDAIFISKSGNTALIRSSGIDSKKKVATAMAVKSALYTYYFIGIEGLNDGKPLLGRTPSQAAKEYAMNILNGEKYSIFVKSFTLDEATSKNIGKDYQAVVTTEIYDSAVYKDLVNNKVIGQQANKMSLSDTQDEISLPTIMVVPYCRTGENFRDKMEGNPDMKVAVAKVTEGFIEKGVTTRNVEQSIRDAAAYKAVNGGLSLNDMMINNSGAEVMVYVDITKDVSNEGLKITLILNAVEVSTKGDLASKTEISGRKNATSGVICKALVDLLIDDFLKQISTNMANKISKGNSISVNFAIDPGSAMNMDSEVGNEFLPLSDAIIKWVKANAKDGKYHQKGRSETKILLDEINIDNKSKTGESMDINDFSLKLYQYMRGLNLTIKRNIVNSTIEITIM